MLALADAAPGIAGLFEGKPALRGKAMLEQCAPQDQHIHPGISAPGHGVARQAGGCSPDTAPRLDPREDRKSVGKGKSVAVRVDLGGRRTMKNKKERTKQRKKP